jgi:hypothetical protein
LLDDQKLAVQQTPGRDPLLYTATVDEYVEYAADSVQIIPLSLLPVLGAVFAVSKDTSSVLCLSYLCGAIFVAVALDVIVLNKSTPDYVSRKLWGYSIVAWVAFASNVAGLAVVLTAFMGR